MCVNLPLGGRGGVGGCLVQWSHLWKFCRHSLYQVMVSIIVFIVIIIIIIIIFAVVIIFCNGKSSLHVPTCEIKIVSEWASKSRPVIYIDLWPSYYSEWKHKNKIYCMSLSWCCVFLSILGFMVSHKTRLCGYRESINIRVQDQEGRWEKRQEYIGCICDGWCMYNVTSIINSFHTLIQFWFTYTFIYLFIHRKVTWRTGEEEEEGKGDGMS